MSWLLGSFGVWLSSRYGDDAARAAWAVEAEELGYGTVWLGAGADPTGVLALSREVLDRTSRVVVGPPTRCRATNPDLLPTDMQARYYSQRASAGLIITKGTWHDVPGIFTRRPGAHLVSFCAALAHRLGVASGLLQRQSTVRPIGGNRGVLSPTPLGNNPTVAPKAMTRDDIRTTIYCHTNAAVNAMRAEFDGKDLVVSGLPTSALYFEVSV